MAAPGIPIDQLDKDQLKTVSYIKYGQIDQKT